MEAAGNFRTGDIVCVSYGDFKGNKRVGIFLILYNEKQNRQCNGQSNIICAKLTTNNLYGDGYTVRLNQGEANLESDCLVNLSKLHTFTNNRIYKYIGSLNEYRMSQVFKEYRKFTNEVEAQLMELF